jgi:hypothetical protein
MPFTGSAANDIVQTHLGNAFDTALVCTGHVQQLYILFCKCNGRICSRFCARRSEERRSPARRQTISIVGNCLCCFEIGLLFAQEI